MRNEGTPFTPIDIAEGSMDRHPISRQGRWSGARGQTHVRNADDRLRQHAVVSPETGWAPTPVIDVVPHPGRGQHVCAPVPGIES